MAKLREAGHAPYHQDDFGLAKLRQPGAPRAKRGALLERDVAGPWGKLAVLAGGSDDAAVRAGEARLSGRSAELGAVAEIASQ